LSSAETRVAIGGGIADQLWVELLAPGPIDGPNQAVGGH
jgi:hypothetical protein